MTHRKDLKHFEYGSSFYGPGPTIKPLSRIREGASGFNLEVEYGNTWGSHSELPLDLVWDVRRVLLDDEPLDVKQTSKHDQSWTGHHSGSLPAGKYELTMAVDCAYIDHSKLIGLNAGQLPSERWPKAAKRWKQVVSTPLKVYSSDERIVKFSSDTNRDPRRAKGISIERLVAQTHDEGAAKIIAQLDSTSALSIPVSFDVAVRLDRQTVELGSVWIVPHGGGFSRGGGALEEPVASLDPATTRVDVVLTPDPSHIEHRPEVAEIWGKQVVFRNVPIERLDLEAGQSAKQP